MLFINLPYKGKAQNKPPPPPNKASKPGKGVISGGKRGTGGSSTSQSVQGRSGVQKQVRERQARGARRKGQGRRRGHGHIQMMLHQSRQPNVPEKPLSKIERTQLVERLMEKSFISRSPEMQKMKDTLTQSVELHSNVVNSLKKLSERIKDKDTLNNADLKSDLLILLQFAANLREIRSTNLTSHAVEANVLLGLGSHLSEMWSWKPNHRGNALDLLQTYNRNRQQMDPIIGFNEVYRKTLHELGYKSPQEKAEKTKEMRDQCPK